MKIEQIKDAYNYLEPLTHHPTMTGIYCDMLKIAVNVLKEQIEKEYAHNFYKCENCKHLSESEKTNRLYCSYHSEGHLYEVYKDEYCSYFEKLESKS